MNITDADGKWCLRDHSIENRKTGEVRTVENMPSANTIAYMNYKTFVKKCSIAFDSGEWPMNNCPTCDRPGYRH